MLPGWLAISAFLVYAATLFALARYGDGPSARLRSPGARKAIYALSACVYCNSLGFYGAVGLASDRGFDFLPLYIGPAIVFVLLTPIFIRMIRLAKAQSMTSIADFVAARYGKSTSVAATVTIIAVLAYIPFIALQLKAIGQSLAIFVEGTIPARSNVEGTCRLMAILVGALLTVLAIAIGARRLDATGHQRGLMLVLASETIVRVTAMLGVGVFVCWSLFDGVTDLTEHVVRDDRISAIMANAPDPAVWLPLIAAVVAATFVMPQQFQVSVIENDDEADVRTAAWVVPLSILAVVVFVLPIAAAGLSIFPDGTIDRDVTILALPIHAGQSLITLLALVGGFSAGTAMILLATQALSVMMCNDVAMPIMLRLAGGRFDRAPILAIRRIAIVAIMALATLCAIATSGATLSSIGLCSLVGVVQIAPAALIGMIWRRGTARGAVGGTIAGLLVCLYTIGLPAILPHSSPLMLNGPLAIQALRPTALFGTDIAPFGQGLAWSLTVNLLFYVVLSLGRGAKANERLQAEVFVDPTRTARAALFRARHSSVSVADLLAAVSHFAGQERTHRAFRDYHAAADLEVDLERDADTRLIQVAEHLIASVVGTSTSRLVVSMIMEKGEMSRDAAQRVADDVSLEIQNSRDILQHAIDIARDGMAIYDSDLRLVAWNRAYREMFQLPAALMRVGTPIDELIRSNAERGIYGDGVGDRFVEERFEALTRPTEGLRLHMGASNRVLEMRSVRLNNGGIFFTYTDATAQAQSEEELEAENETLELRVRERTEQLESLNIELLRAKADAEDANISKSRFLAAASHDILQPLSAARLYATSLHERLRARASGEDAQMLAANVDAALEAVEDILGALLEISQLDAGATKTEITAFDIQTILGQLKMEFEPIALERGLLLTVMPSSLRVQSDRKLLRRLLQNLISNALKYTPEGRVLVGARRVGQNVSIDVHDSGIGIPAAKQGVIFREFERLPAGAQVASGAGLGLSIVQRLSTVLHHDIKLRSEPGTGSMFSVVVPRAPHVSAELQTNIASFAAPRQGSLDGLVVAAIDNERPILAGMKSLLQGWKCIVVGDTELCGLEAALEARHLVPDVIIADYHVGDLNGLAIIAALRRRHGHCPAVLITADRSTTVRDLALAVDVRVLNKPLKPAALRSLLAQWRLVKFAAE